MVVYRKAFRREPLQNPTSPPTCHISLKFNEEKLINFLVGEGRDGGYKNLFLSLPSS